MTDMNVITCPNCTSRNRVPKDATGIPKCGNCHQPLPWIVDADDTDFEAVADRATLPVLVDLWATWCGPCRAVSPALERLAKDRASRIKLVKVDIDKSPRMARRFAVQAVPTLVVLYKGDIVAEQTGAAPVNVLAEWLDLALASIADLVEGADKEEGVAI
jgi:thioredoxin 2